MTKKKLRGLNVEFQLHAQGHTGCTLGFAQTHGVEANGCTGTHHALGVELQLLAEHRLELPAAGEHETKGQGRRANPARGGKGRRKGER
jgi:hypothetical protein